MAQQANFIDEGIDRVQEAWSSVEDEISKVQKTLEKRRKKFEKDAEKRVKKFEKTPVGKRLVSIRKDARKQLEDNVESFLGILPVASAAEVKRLERKVATLTRKVNALEKAKSAPKAASKSTTPTA